MFLINQSKLNNGNTRAISGICLKLTTKIAEGRHWLLFDIRIVNFERISHIQVFPFGYEQVNAAWDLSKICIQDIVKINILEKCSNREVISKRMYFY